MNERMAKGIFDAIVCLGMASCARPYSETPQFASLAIQSADYMLRKALEAGGYYVYHDSTMNCLAFAMKADPR